MVNCRQGQNFYKCSTWNNRGNNMINKRILKQCDICGKHFEGIKTSKYCLDCQAKILEHRTFYKSYKNSVTALKIMYRHKKIYDGSVSDVIRQCKKSGKSYGYEVARLEGRI